MYEYKNVSYMELSIGLEEDDYKQKKLDLSNFFYLVYDNFNKNVYN